MKDASDWWGLVMALAAIVVPLWLAWALLAWGARKREGGSAPAPQRNRP